MEEKVEKEHKADDTSQTPRSRTMSLSKGKGGERGKERERANSISVTDLWRIRDEEKNKKRMRKEKETEITEIFKKSNKMVRTPSKEGEERKEEEKGEEEEVKEESVMWLVLEEIKRIRIEMVDGREEVKSEIKSLESRIARMEEGWRVREKEMEIRVVKLEEKLEEMEKKTENEEKETEGEKNRRGNVRSEVEKAEKEEEKVILKETKREIEKMKRKLEEKEKKERRNNIIVKGLEWKSGNKKEEVKEFLTKEFGIGKKIRNTIIFGRKEREWAMVEIEDWETKQAIMRDKKKLRGKNIFIDHDLTKEEREIQKALRDRAEKERKEG